MIKKYVVLIFCCIQVVSLAQQNFPEWAKGIVWYQIFPERFSNGDVKNDPTADKVFIHGEVPEGWKVSEWTSNWFQQSKWEKKLGGPLKNHLYQRRYGGDLKGIINHLDYLKDLGVTGIYLNPVFEAVSLHKYDGSTFHHIDVNFSPDPEGDKKLIESEIPEDPATWKWTAADRLFLELINEVHKRGMRIIIDGVFNHVGREFWAFKDLIKNQEKSKYKEWFQVKMFDDPVTDADEFDYQGWWDHKSLPQFNRTKTDLAAGPKQYVFYATRKWMDPNEDGNLSDGIDGWRLDVARDVPIGFWKDWSALVKSINKEAIIIGELWEISKDFISEDGVFDALMNYNFAYAVNDFFIAEREKISVSDLISRLEEIQESYPEKNIDILQNLLASHDTERLMSMIKNPDRKYEWDANENNPNYDPSKPGIRELNKLRLIAAFQMTYKGAPMIYYGDEVGMWGADDPHDRKPMIWGDLKYDDEVLNESSGFSKGFGTYTVQTDKDILNYYKQLTSIRNKSIALKEGSVKFIYQDNSTLSFAFERKSGNERIICLFNLGRSDTFMKLELGQSKIGYSDLMTDEIGTMIPEDDAFTFKVKGMSVKIINVMNVK